MFRIAPFYRQNHNPVNDEEEQTPMFSSLMEDFNQPEEEMQTPMFDRYMELASNQPRREDFQPSTGRRILGGLIGGLTGLTSGAERGIKAGQDITEGPYRQAMTDWKSEIEPIKEGVGFERAFGETLRKRQNDRNNYGSKVAKIEADYIKAKDSLAVAKQKANTADELARIKDAELALDQEYKRAKIGVDRTNAQSGRMKAEAAQVGAAARMMNANNYGNQERRPRHVPISEQIKSEAVGAKEALDQVMAQMPSVKGIKLDESGNLVFPKDMVPQVQEKFNQIWQDTKAKIAKERLSRTY